MRDHLVGLLEKADLAVASASGVIADEIIAPLIDSVRSVRTRLAYPDDVLVVALAGGTGSGKSSLLNAICGEELADVGGIRPTTSRPAAAVPASAGAAMGGYLDALGIEERHAHGGPPICLLDLPDIDSVVVQHRHRVDGLLPVVDMVVWVVDPEKYRDARLHQAYLTPMSDYSAQLLVVLNQADRLGEADLEAVRADLERALEEDQIRGVPVIAMAAAPPSGPPIGLDVLLEALEVKRADRSILYRKLLTDLAATCRRLEEEAGSGLDFDARAQKAVVQASNALSFGDGTGATAALTEFLGALEAEAGGETGEKLAAISADVPDHVRRIEDQLPPTPEPVGRIRRLFGPAKASDERDRREQAGLLLSEAVIRPARAVLARRAVAVASVADLAIEIDELRSSTRGGSGP